MLNELWTLDRSLERFQVDVEEPHQSVKRLGRVDLLIASLDPAGLVAKIEYLDKSEAVALFKIQESNRFFQLQHRSVVSLIYSFS